MPADPERRAEDDRPEPIIRTATQARGGEIILGKSGRIIWIGSFVAILVLLIATMFI